MKKGFRKLNDVFKEQIGWDFDSCLDCPLYYEDLCDERKKWMLKHGLCDEITRIQLFDELNIIKAEL